MSRRSVAVVAGLALLAAIAAGAFLLFLRHHGRRYHATLGAHVRELDFRSRLLRRTLPEILVMPPGAARGRPLLVLLHGRGMGPAGLLSDPFFRALASLGAAAPVVVLANGGDHSYFHDRADGPWGTYVVRELIPWAARTTGADARRVAIGGVSMGGFGALDLARLDRGRFCAVGGHSAALWKQAGETAPGAFDDAADFARHDLFAAARRNADLFGRTPLWLDVGADDPFRAADTAFAALLRRDGEALVFHTWPGDHDTGYWDAHMPGYLRFYARALTRC